MVSRDPSLDVLLDLDGQVLVVDPEGGHWVRLVVTRGAVSPEKPRGLDYSLTLHGPDGERLVGFDNAHPVAKQKRGEPQDHRHRLQGYRDLWVLKVALGRKKSTEQVADQAGVLSVVRIFWRGTLRNSIRDSSSCR